MSVRTTLSSGEFVVSTKVKIFVILFYALIVMFYVLLKAQGTAGYIYLVVSALVGGYMAMNIGANDVANNVGPTVGSKAIGMLAAVIIAMIFEAAGAIFAGGDVVKTIKNGIIDQSQIKNSIDFIWIMMSALAAAGIWLNCATYFRAPVSTTHSIVGGVIGAGIAAGGWSLVNWNEMLRIVSSWVISPVMGGVIATILLYFVKSSIFYSDNRLSSARKVVPLLIGFMAWAFSFYLISKGAKHLVHLSFINTGIISLIFALCVYSVATPYIKKATLKSGDEKYIINELFTLPLIFSAIILSFAHGANDVANAIGPLAAINDAVLNNNVAVSASIPMWVMMVGAIGISLGLALFGPRLINTVGTEITDINKMRAYCIAMSASITVIIASQLGLPISSTHVAVGAVFGVGFLREILNANYNKIIDEVRHAYYEEGNNNPEMEMFLDKFIDATSEEKSLLLRELKTSGNHLLKNSHRKKLKKAHKEQLVKRSVFFKVIAAWFITVPCSALLSAIFFYIFKLTL